MTARVVAATLLLGAGFLSACSSALLAPDERSRVCRVAVTAKPGALAFKHNPLADPVGGPAIGAGAGALALIAAIAFPPYLFVAPAAAVHGAACGAASVQRPTAEADFERIVRTADMTPLGTSVVTEVGAARPGCADPGNGAVAPDTGITLDRIEFAPGCAYGDRDYAIVANWRVTRTVTGTAVATATTQCGVSTYREVEAWFDDSEAARAEVETVLRAVGRRVAAELLAGEKLPVCHIGVPKSGAASTE